MRDAFCSRAYRTCPLQPMLFSSVVRDSELAGGPTQSRHLGSPLERACESQNLRTSERPPLEEPTVPQLPGTDTSDHSSTTSPRPPTPTHPGQSPYTQVDEKAAEKSSVPSRNPAPTKTCLRRTSRPDVLLGNLGGSQMHLPVSENSPQQVDG